MRLFIDTWGWITICNRKEPRHKEVRVFYENFRKAKGVVYTSDYVLDETLTLLFKRMPFEQAKKFIEHLDAAI